MRAFDTRNGLRLRAYAGTTGVLLAMNVTAHKRKGLLGFAIERLGPGNQHRWLRGLLRFPGQPGAYLTPVDSNVAPIQKFRWSDYSVYPDTGYHYRLQGVYGSPGNLRYKEGGEVSIVTESLDSGLHRVIFNRAAAASQAYTRRFGNANPDEPDNHAARQWLSRGMYEKLVGFLQRADGPDWALDVAIYEIELAEVVDLLRFALEKGARVRVVYHGKSGDEQTIVNEQYLRNLPITIRRARVTSSLFHQKFVVLSRRQPDGIRSPQAVLTGSANFTPNGIYRQANVVHVVADAHLAAQYLALFNQVFDGASTRRTKAYIDAENPIVPSRRQVIFSPRSGFGDIAEVAAILAAARREVVFCTAFRLHPDILAALTPPTTGKVIRYGLQNSRSAITGTHRYGSFVTKAFLKEGLEGFLKESTAGQRGSILVHLKTIVCDFSAASPLVITGSNNFSAASSAKNDENMLIVRGETDVCDTYLCEMMRLYDHYRFRFNRTKRGGRGLRRRLRLAADDGWTAPYFEAGSLKSLERARFAGRN